MSEKCEICEYLSRRCASEDCRKRLLASNDLDHSGFSEIEFERISIE